MTIIRTLAALAASALLLPAAAQAQELFGGVYAHAVGTK